MSTATTVLPIPAYSSRLSLARNTRRFASWTAVRSRLTANEASGFLYMISRTGVTGAQDELPADLADCLARVRTAVPEMPIAVGFGIARPQQVRAVAQYADGVVVGSALVALIEEFAQAPDLEDRIERFCHQLTGR